MQARRQQRERILGVVLAILGVAVLVVAIVALTRPDSDKNTAVGGSTSSAAPTASATPTSSAPVSSPSKSSKSKSSDAQPGASLSLGGSSSGSGKTKKLPLVVLNNTRTTGLATDAAAEFRNGGWTVERVGNIQDDIISSCAYYDPDVDGAEQAAKALRKQFSGIRRTAEKFSGLDSGPIVVVLTSGYSSN